MHFKHYKNPYSGLAQYVNCAAANPGADAGMYDASEQYKLSTISINIAASKKLLQKSGGQRATACTIYDVQCMYDNQKK